MLLEELVDNGMATLKDGKLSIGLDDFYALEPGARAWLMPGNAIEGEVHVRIDGALGKEDALWHAEVEVDGQTFTEASMAWPYIRIGQDLKMLGRDQASATALVLDVQQNPSMSNQYRALEALQKLECVVMSDSLRTVKAYHVARLAVNAVEEEGGIRLGLVVGAADEPWQSSEMEVQMARKNRRRALGHSDGPLRRLYRTEEGARICLSEEAVMDVGKAFDLMHRPMPRKKWAERLLEDPTLGMDPEKIDLSAFSERVRELGVFVGQGRLELMKSGNEWLPEIVLHGNAEIPLRMRIETEEDLTQLKVVIRAATSAGDEVVEVEGVFVSLREAKEVMALCERQLKEDDPLKEGAGALVPIVIEDDEADLDLSKRIELGHLEVEPPPFLKPSIQLRPHQREGVAWMQKVSKDRLGTGVLLADDMGLGKTLQVWSYLHWRILSPGSDVGGPTMVVAPVSLLENWRAEYTKFFEPKLHIHMPSPQDLKHMDWRKLDKFDVLLVNYERLTRNALHAGQVNWGIIALDEAQKVKNPGTAISHVVKSLKAQFRIAITGTPVENTLVDFWNIMDFVEPGLLGGKQEFVKRFKVQSDDVTMLAAARELRDSVGWHMLRRLKEDVAQDLPSKTLEPAGWMPMDGLHKWGDELTEDQHRVYAGIQVQHSKDVEGGGGPQAMLRAIEGWQLTCDHPLLAAKSWAKVEAADTPALIRQSAKLNSTIAILKKVQERGEKVLVFSKFRATQLLLKRVVQDTFGLRVSIINGDVPSSQQAATKAQLSRQALVDRFNESEGFQVMVLSPIAAGFGLNIQSANHVVHYTRHWNPAKEAQATDRAYRIGQTKPVTVYYPMSLSTRFKTFDANLHLLLERKAKLAKEALVPSPSVQLKDFEGLH